MTVATRHSEPPHLGGEESRSLPDGWRWVRLDQVCNLVNGDAYQPRDWSRSGTRIVRIENLNDHSKPFNHWAGPLHDRVKIKDGDVLLAWSGTPGTSFGAHLWRRGDAILNQHIFRIDFTVDSVLPEWFVYAVNYQLDGLIHKAHGGVGLRHVKKGEVQALRIPLAPLPEQRRIAAALQDQLAAIDRARAAAEEQLKAAQALPAAYLRAIFNSPEAQQWPTKHLGEVSSLLPAKSISTRGDVDVIAITTACLTETGFDPAGVKRARMRADDAIECRLAPGEILIARSNTPELVGRVAMYAGEPEEVVASDLTIRIKPMDKIDPRFLTAYLSFLYLSGHWKERAGGASGSMKKITRSQIIAQSVPLLPFAEQQGIIAELKQYITTAEQARIALQAQLDAINRLPAALLRRAFNGEL